MRVSSFAFVAAALMALTGMGLGMYMAIAEDFTLAPAHAHLNLLGWVTVALYGLYHRGVARACNRLAWIQTGAGALGAPTMAGGLGVYLAAGSGALVPVIFLGALLSITAMALFIVQVVLDLRQRTPRPTVGAALPAE